MEFSFGKGRKLCGKRGKCWLSAFSLYPIMFLVAFFPRVVKIWHCLEESIFVIRYIPICAID